MAMMNHPDKIVLDSFSDPNLELSNPNGVYSRFTNRLTTPILNAKGVLLLNANFINPIMQLNDASQLIFFYYAQSSLTNFISPPVSDETAFTSITGSIDGIGGGQLSALSITNPIPVGNRFVISGATGTAAASVNGQTFTAIAGTNGTTIFFRSSAAAGTILGATITPVDTLRCIRLMPSNFVPASGFTSFVQNKYFNTVSELVAALNLAAASGGDDTLYNPYFIPNQVTFSYDAALRRISVTSAIAGLYIAPAPADDPNVLTLLRGTGGLTRLKMKTFGATNYATATFQPYVENISMNARLGFAMNYSARGLYWNGSSLQGCATSTGVPQLFGVPILADAPPILIGSQNVNVYTNITTGGGMDSLNGKNLLATIPLEAPALNVNSYTMSSVEKPSLSTPQEIYEITVEFRDDYGTPVQFPPNYNTELQISLFY